MYKVFCALNLLFLFSFSNVLGSTEQPKASRVLKPKVKSHFKKGAIHKATSLHLKHLKAYEEKQEEEQLLEGYIALYDLKTACPIHKDYDTLLQKIDSLNGVVNSKRIGAEVLRVKAEQNIEFHLFQKALNQLNKALDFYEESDFQGHKEKIRIYANLIRVGMKQWKRESITTYYEKAKQLLEGEELEGKLFVHSLFTNYGAAQYQLGNFVTAKKSFREAGKTMDEKYAEKHPIHANYHYAMAKVFLRTSQLDSVFNHVDQGLKVLESQGMVESELGGSLYFVKAQAYEIPENHTKSLRLLKKVEEIFYQTLAEHDNRLFQVRLAMVRCYNNLDRLEQGLKVSEEALEFVEDQPALNVKRVNFNKARIHQHLAKIQRKKGNLKEAKDAVNKSLQYYKAILPPGHLNFASVYSEYYQIALSGNQYDTALMVLNEMKPVLENSFASRGPQFVDYRFVKFAQIYSFQGKFQKALEKCQKGFELITTDFYAGQDLANPRLEQVVEPEVGYYLGHEKHIALTGYYRHEGGMDILKKAYETALLTDSLSNTIRNDFLLRDDHGTWLNKNAKFYPLSMMTFNELLKKNISESFKDQIKGNAFLFAEKDKASLLSAAHAENEIMSSETISDSLLKPIQAINQKIEQLNKKLRGKDDSAERLTLQNQRLEKVQAKEELYNELCKEYPSQCKELKGMKVTDLRALQSDLEDQGKNMVEYIGRDSLWFALTITTDKVHLTELKRVGDLATQVHAFRDHIVEKPFSSGVETSHDLYQKLFAPIEQHLNSGEIVIVPDGVLGYLPFSALIPENHGEKAEKNFNFLVEDYAISYSPSATLWQHQKKANGGNLLASSNQVFAGFAPSFQEEGPEGSQLAERDQEDTLRSVLGKIPFAKEEVKNVMGLLPGKIHIGTKATEAQFKAMARDFSIIHLATHGLLDDENPAFNKLVFAKDSNSSEDGNLHTYELYNLDLNADLTVLSACNTGYGTVKQGEGVLNMARGFKVAGSPNILMTLWSINDRSSSDLMNLFYKNLKEGQSKSKALQNAKIEYMDEHDQNTANPFYWAGFVMMGSNQDVQVNNAPSSLYLWLAGGFGILFLSWVYWRSKRKKAA